MTTLALAARDGDRVALTAFVRATQADVWRLCRHLGDLTSADDLTQETYLRAVPALARFRGDASARTWLLGIARRVCADAVRSARRRRTLPGHVSEPVPDPAASSALVGLVEALDPDRRDAFVLTQVLGLSYAETADVCGVPIGTVRSRVARARADLVGAIGDEVAQ